MPGSARRYLDTNDIEISRREYESRRLRPVGWKSWTEYQNIKKSDQWLRLEGIYTHNQNLRRNQIGPESEFALEYLALRNARDRGDNVNKANGPLAKWLKTIGLVPENADWDIESDPNY